MTTPAEMNDFNKQLVEEFRASEGKVGGMFEGKNVLLLTTIGAKSGEERLSPLVYTRDGDRYVVAASMGGAPKNPAWYLNLRDNPRVTVQVGSETRPMIAETARGEERQRLWDEFVRRHPRYGDYQKKTTREIPVVILKPA